MFALIHGPFYPFLVGVRQTLPVLQEVESQFKLYQQQLKSCLEQHCAHPNISS
jgi:hypothetical protein